MTDPLAEIVTLLQPCATLSKVVEGAGRWRLRRTDGGQPFYCVVLHGGCRLTAAGHDPVALAAGGFVLIPAAHDFVVSSAEAPPPGRYDEPVVLASGGVRLGAADAPPDVTLLVGHCAFVSPDAALLVSLLVAIPLHLFGYVMTLRDDRIFEILFVRSTKCPPRSRAFWAADSYAA